MKSFEYRKVFTLQEAFHLLDRYGEGARILAGGTDLLVKMRNRAIHPEILIDLKGVAGLDGIHYDPAAGLRIGALASIHRLENSPLLREKFVVISQSASYLGSYQIRTRATLGGNLCHASPAADMIPGLISLGGKAKILSKTGGRLLPLEDFFIGPGRSHLRPGEILTEIQVPNLPTLTGSHYAKHSIRKAMDMAVVGVAVTLSAGQGPERCEDVRIALGAVGPVPLRATEAEMCLRGRKVDDHSIFRAALLASEQAKPITDVRASGDYRKEMVRVLTYRAIKQVWESLGRGEISP